MFVSFFNISSLFVMGWDDFNGNITIFNIYKSRHSDVIIIKHTWYSELNSLQKVPFGFLFCIWKINRIMLFCNYLSNNPHISTWTMFRFKDFQGILIL